MTNPSSQVPPYADPQPLARPHLSRRIPRRPVQSRISDFNCRITVVLDDLRQNVAAWGDEGMVMRVFRASICLMLLGILDTLIDLLADFRAGRLPPVLPAEDETVIPSKQETEDTGSATPQSGDTAVPRSRGIYAARAPFADDPRAGDAIAVDPLGDPVDAPEQNVTIAPFRRRTARAPSRLPIRRPEPAPRGLAGYPSAVPRPPAQKSGHWDHQITHAHFITISKYSRTPAPCPSAAWKYSSPTRPAADIDRAG
jgi:hypothetical protein